MKVYYTKVFPFLEESTFFSQLNKVEEERRRKILSGSNEKVRLLSLTAGSLLHEALCWELKIAADKKGPFEVAYTEGGKPYLPDNPKLHFNLSHSGAYVCCAVSGEPVGVDIQQITEVKEGMAERFFTEKDKQRLSALSGEEKKQLFFRMWSIKESYLKLTGKGIAAGLDSFEIDWMENKIVDGKSEAAYYEEYNGLPEYCLCVCMGAPCKEVVWEEILSAEI